MQLSLNCFVTPVRVCRRGGGNPYSFSTTNEILLGPILSLAQLSFGPLADRNTGKDQSWQQTAQVKAAVKTVLELGQVIMRIFLKVKRMIRPGDGGPQIANYARWLLSTTASSAKSKKRAVNLQVVKVEPLCPNRRLRRRGATTTSGKLCIIPANDRDEQQPEQTDPQGEPAELGNVDWKRQPLGEE